jgi:hypothetical protein
MKLCLDWIKRKEIGGMVFHFYHYLLQSMMMTMVVVTVVVVVVMVLEEWEGGMWEKDTGVRYCFFRIIRSTLDGNGTEACTRVIQNPPE